MVIGPGVVFNAPGLGKYLMAIGPGVVFNGPGWSVPV